MYTIDASVWVNSFDQREAGHTVSRQVLTTLRTKGVAIIVPTLVLVEVAGAVSRTRQRPGRAQSFAAALSGLPNIRLVPLDSSLAQLALQLAAQHSLRGADAVYAAVALQSNSTLITLDNEQLTRLAGVLATLTPLAALSTL